MVKPPHGYDQISAYAWQWKKKLAKNTNLDAVIDDFAMKKARKRTL